VVDNPYESGWDDDDRIRCWDCREGFYKGGDITVCPACEEWICAGCMAAHQCEKE